MQSIIIFRQKLYKMKNLFLIVFLVSFSATSLVTAQTSRSQEEKNEIIYNNCKAAVKAMQYNFVADWVFKDNQREQLESNSNGITINESEISGKLISSVANNAIFSVDGTIENYTTKFDEESKRIMITFKVNTKTDILAFSIKVMPTGNTFLDVSSTENGSISYRGRLSKL